MSICAKSLISWCFILSVTLLASCAQVAPKSVSTTTEKVAYLRYTNNFWQVWVTDVNGSFHQQLTFDEVDKSRISWSNSIGQLLVNSNDGTLSLLNIDTKQILPVPLDSLEVFDAQISPDGKQITYTATTSLQADNAEVWIANLDGSAKTKITNNTTVTLSPSWNPKTGSILFSAGSPGKNQELWQVSLDVNKSEQITVSPFSSLDPNANSKGEILYSSNQTGHYNIWLLDASQKKRQVTNSKTYDGQPVWNKSGEIFVFFRISNNKKQIWLYHLDSGKETPLTLDAFLSRGAVWID
jgi:Tol biopolymer transport system component